MRSDTIPARLLLGATNLCASSHDAEPLIDKDTTSCHGILTHPHICKLNFVDAFASFISTVECGAPPLIVAKF